jgi:pimeloyl-ACP methyl ester carboxylesterase
MTESMDTLRVPHLGGIVVGYRLSRSPPSKSKPTLVLFNPFTATADYYLPEFSNAALRDEVNLLAIEPLGHGLTRAEKTESFTYWDTAIMTLQLLDALGIDQFFVLGTSQGGWIAVRTAILAPERVRTIPNKLVEVPKKQRFTDGSPRSRA